VSLFLQIEAKQTGQCASVIRALLNHRVIVGIVAINIGGYGKVVYSLMNVAQYSFSWLKRLELNVEKLERIKKN
jgi:hypothetical protein